MGGVAAAPIKLVSNLFGKAKEITTPSTPQTVAPQTPIVPPPDLAAPTTADPAAQAAAEEALRKAKKNKGRANTILSGQGTVGEDTTAAKQLLGG